MKIISREEARAAGLKRYFTGEPCCNGHIDERMVSINMCVACKRMYKKRWQERHPEQHQNGNRRRAAEWRETNRERHREGSRACYWRNRDDILTARKEERRLNPEKVRAAERARKSSLEYRLKHRAQVKAWRKANKEKAYGYVAAWFAKNPDKQNIYIRNRRARLAGASGTHSTEDIRRIRVLQKNKCAYCRVTLTKKNTHVDHIIPLFLGGSNDRTNLQLLCVPCNLTKCARDPHEFARSLGLLL